MKKRTIGLGALPGWHRPELLTAFFAIGKILVDAGRVAQDLGVGAAVPLNSLARSLTERVLIAQRLNVRRLREITWKSRPTKWLDVGQGSRCALRVPSRLYRASGRVCARLPVRLL